MNYKQLSDAQRYQIESYLRAHYSITAIAQALEVSKSTISRELKRNGKKRSYNASFASRLSKERRKEAYKHHVFDCSMKRYITDKLTNKQWSPKQFNGRCDIEGIVGLLRPLLATTPSLCSGQAHPTTTKALAFVLVQVVY